MARTIRNTKHLLKRFALQFGTDYTNNPRFQRDGSKWKSQWRHKFNAKAIKRAATQQYVQNFEEYPLPLTNYKDSGVRPTVFKL